MYYSKNGVNACTICTRRGNLRNQEFTVMQQLFIVLILARIIDFIKTVFFGDYPPGPLGMGY